MVKKYDVFGIGTALVDYFTRSTDGFLARKDLVKGATNFVPRQKLNDLHAEFSDSVFACLPGDNARNVCEGVRFLGGGAAYAGRIANDKDGEIFEKSMRNHGIDSFLEKKSGHTGKIIAFITPDSQRTFAADLGNGVEYSGLPSNGIKCSNFLYMTSITLLKKGEISKSARKAIEFAEENNVRVSISLENPPMVGENKDKLLEVIYGADVLFANEDELESLVGSGDSDAAIKLAKNVNVFYLKKGKAGSVVLSNEQEFSIPAYSAKVVDTTGAGDFYAAGVLFALSRGNSLEESGNQGAKLAAKVIEKFGASLYKS